MRHLKVRGGGLDKFTVIIVAIGGVGVVDGTGLGASYDHGAIHAGFTTVDNYEGSATMLVHHS
jgi:hypothetical protein